MNNPSAEVRLEQTVHGTGTLIRDDDTLPVASFTLERLKYQRRVAWDFTAYVAEENWDKWDIITRIGSSRLRFVGVTDTEQDITIPQVLWKKQIRGRLYAEVQEWHTNSQPLPNPPTSQFVTIQLSDTPLALSEISFYIRDWTGEIRADGSRRPPVLWQSSLGEVQLSRRYIYEDGLIEGSSCTVRIGIPTLSLKVAPESTRSDLTSLRSALDAEITDALRVISFLSRGHTRWFRLWVGSQWEHEGQMQMSEAEWNRSIGRTHRREAEPLINPYRPGPEAIGSMISRFRGLAFKEAASSAIIYLIESRHSEHVESHLVNAFTALESLVSGWGEAHQTNHTFGSSQFKRLRALLGDNVRTFGEQSGTAEERTQDAIDKLQELRRRPIVNQVIDLINELDIPCHDVWPAQVDIRTGLKDAFGRRNRFVHAGQLHSVRQAHVDATRIHAIAERILFRLIGGDFAWQDYRAYEHLEGLTLVESSQV